MKINDYKVGTIFITNCTKVKQRYCGEETNVFIYDSFGINPLHASIWGRNPEDIVKVKCTVIEEDVIISDLMKRDSGYDENCTDYFGWIDMEKEDNYDIAMIFANIKLYFVCFPYGPDAGRFWNYDVENSRTYEIEHHKGDRRGMTVRLKIEEI